MFRNWCDVPTDAMLMLICQLVLYILYYSMRECVIVDLAETWLG